MGHGGGDERRGPDEDPDDYFRDPGEEVEAEERRLAMAQETANAGRFAAVARRVEVSGGPIADDEAQGGQVPVCAVEKRARGTFLCRDCGCIYWLSSRVSSCRHCGSVSRDAHILEENSYSLRRSRRKVRLIPAANQSYTS